MGISIFHYSVFSQKENNIKFVSNDSIQKIEYNNIDPLSPARAAFYSTVIPGLGQAYNKKYWKIPIIYAGMGAGIYYFIKNDKEYNRYRDAYKRRIAGFTDDEFSDENGEPILSEQSLIRGQEYYSKNKELSIIVTAAFYLLNILDANIDAHLMQFNVNEDLSIKPDVYTNEIDYKPNLRLSVNYKF